MFKHAVKEKGKMRTILFFVSFVLLVIIFYLLLSYFNNVKYASIELDYKERIEAITAFDKIEIEIDEEGNFDKKRLKEYEVRIDDGKEKLQTIERDIQTDRRLYKQLDIQKELFDLIEEKFVELELCEMLIYEFVEEAKKIALAYDNNLDIEVDEEDEFEEEAEDEEVFIDDPILNNRNESTNSQVWRNTNTQSVRVNQNQNRTSASSNNKKSTSDTSEKEKKKKSEQKSKDNNDNKQSTDQSNPSSENRNPESGQSDDRNQDSDTGKTDGQDDIPPEPENNGKEEEDDYEETNLTQ